MNKTIAARMKAFGVALENAEVVVPAPIEEIPEGAVVQVDSGMAEAMAMQEADAQVVEAETVLDQLQEDQGQLSEIAVTLESFVKANKPMSAEAAAMAALAVRHVTRRYGMSNAIPSVECFGIGQASDLTNTRVSLESVNDRLKQFKEWIIQVVKSLAASFKAFIAKAFDRFTYLKKAAETLKAKAEKTDGKRGEIKIPAIHANRLQLAGSYAKDLVGPFEVLRDYAAGSLMEYSDSTNKSLMAYLQAIEATVPLQKKLEEDAHGDALQAYLDALATAQTHLNDEVKAFFDKSVKAVSMFEPGKDDATVTKEFIGGVKLSIATDPESQKLSATLEKSEHDVGDVTALAVSTDDIVKLMDSAIAICDAALGYRTTADSREKFMEELAKFGQGATSDDQRVFPALRQTIMAGLDASKGIERPFFSYLSQTIMSLFAVCGDSLSAYEKADQKALPAA